MAVEHIVTLQFNIIGTKPLIQASCNNLQFDESSGRAKGAKKTETKSPYETAKSLLYEDDDGNFYHPMQAFHTTLMQDTTNRKVGKTAATTLCAQTISSAVENMVLVDPDTLAGKKPRPLGHEDWVCDSRLARNSKTGFVPVHRPKWRKWGGIAILEVDLEYWADAEQASIVITDLLCLTGSKVGLGCGRIRKDGTKWVGMGTGKYRAEIRA